MKKVFLLTVCILSVSSLKLYSQETIQSDARYSQMYREYITSTKQLSTAMNVLYTYIALKSKESTEEQMAVLEKYKTVFAEDFIASYIDNTEAIFKKHISYKDLKKIVKFYNSPAGKKLITALPDINKESIPASKELFESMDIKMGEMLK